MTDTLTATEQAAREFQEKRESLLKMFHRTSAQLALSDVSYGTNLPELALKLVAECREKDAEIERLKEALWSYGAHSTSCIGDGKSCSCGFSEHEDL